MLTSKDFIKIDTINVVSANWKKSLNDSVVKARDKQLLEWLKTQIKLDSIVLKRQ